MATDPELAAIRWGYGLPAASDATPRAMLSRLAGPDDARTLWPGITIAEVGAVVAAFRDARKAADTPAFQEASRSADQLATRGFLATLARAVGAEDSLRERLVAFWANHFTTVPRNRIERALPSVLIDEAIRPHVNRPFAGMLRAVVTHPAMLLYLNQDASIGPGSRKGLKQRRGLNENLARELLELHTLGVGAAYTQGDVRELAELLTGLALDPERGFVFDPGRAEPGPETVLGKTYSGDGLDPIRAVLDDLAIRPETADHIARKLVIHFVSDQPDPALVQAVAARWRDTGGDLLAVTEALVSHPLSWLSEAGKVRQPQDFMIAALRALGLRPDALLALDLRLLRRLILNPLAAMGQPVHQAPGPNGWPEMAADWITPQGLAARIDWAMLAPQRLIDPLPDPRQFVQTALGARAGSRLIWAVGAAETARDGIGLVLTSPEFNRR